MANLQKIIKVTEEQYDTLADGGTVGSYTGLDENFLYLVQDEKEYVDLISNQTIGGEKIFTDGIFFPQIGSGLYVYNQDIKNGFGFNDECIPTILNSERILAMATDEFDGTYYYYTFPTQNGAIPVIDGEGVFTSDNELREVSFSTGSLFSDRVVNEFGIATADSYIALTSNNMLSDADAYHKLYFPDTSEDEYEQYEWTLPSETGTIALVEGVDEKLNSKVDKVEEHSIESSFFSRITASDSTGSKYEIPNGSVAYPKRIGGMSYKSKNLFDINKLVSPSSTINYEEKTITIFQYGVNETTSTLQDICPSLKAGDTLYVNANVSLAEAQKQIYLLSTGKIITFNTGVTITQEDLNSTIYFYANTLDTSQSNTLSNIMFSTEPITEYEDYFEGIRNSAVTEIKSIGANLFNPSETENIDQNLGYISLIDNGVRVGIKNSYTASSFLLSISSKNLIPIDRFKNGATYRIMANVSSMNNIDISGTRIVIRGVNYLGKYTYYQVIDNISSLSKTFTLNFDETIEFIEVNLYCGHSTNSVIEGQHIDYTNIYFGLAEEARDYVPYWEETLRIPEQVQTLDGYGLGINEEYNNYIDYDRKVFVKIVDKIDLGTLTWHYNSSYECFITEILNKAPNQLGICDIYKNIGQGNVYALVDKSYCSNETINAQYVTFFVKDLQYDSDVTAFKNSLNGVELVYALATPIETDISEYLSEYSYKVDNLGTEIVVNEYDQAVPTTIKYNVSINEQVIENSDNIAKIKEKFDDYLPLTGGKVNGNLSVGGTLSANELSLKDNSFRFLATSREATLPNKSGTIAFTDDIPTNYVTTNTSQSISGVKTFTNEVRMTNNLNNENAVSAPSWQTMALFNNTKGNRYAFLPADQIIVEHSTDGGVTWVDAGMTDDQKRDLFIGSNNSSRINIPLNENGVKSTNCMARITFTAMKYNVPEGTPETEKYNYWNSGYASDGERYCSINMLYFWMDASNDKIAIKVEGATGADSNTWVTYYDSGTENEIFEGWTGMSKIPVGWSGNITGKGSSCGSRLVFGGYSQPQNTWNHRITFRTCANATKDDRYNDSKLEKTYTTAQQGIYNIEAYGPHCWNASNYMMENGHMYTWGANQNVIFPNRVFASGFTSTNDLILTDYTTGDSPRLIFLRGNSTTDDFNDWSFIDKSGYLYIQQRGLNSTGWATRAKFTQDGLDLEGKLTVPWANISTLTIGPDFKFGNGTYTAVLPAKNGTVAFIDDLDSYLKITDTISAEKVQGGSINTSGNSPKSVALSPAINGFGAMPYIIQREQGTDIYPCVVYEIDGNVFSLTTDQAARLFEGSLTNILFFDPNSYGTNDTDYEYSETKTYKMGNFCWVETTKDNITKKRWYRCQVESSIDEDPVESTINFEDISANNTYAGIDPKKCERLNVYLYMPGHAMRYENSIALYWRTEEQHPKYYSIYKGYQPEKVTGKSIYKHLTPAEWKTCPKITVVENKEIIGGITNDYLGAFSSADEYAYNLCLSFSGFTYANNYWCAALAEIAISGSGGDLDKTVMFRTKSNEVYGNIKPGFNTSYSLGDNNYKWQNIYAHQGVFTTIKENGTALSSKYLAINSNSHSVAARIYGVKNDGTQSMWSMVSGATSWTIPYRLENGVVNVGTPTADSHATTKKYVDDALSQYADKQSLEEGRLPVIATKATQDGDGNVITSTYATKTEVNTSLNDKANIEGDLREDEIIIAYDQGSITGSGKQLSDYYTKTEVNNLIPKTYIHNIVITGSDLSIAANHTTNYGTPITSLNILINYLGTKNFTSSSMFMSCSGKLGNLFVYGLYMSGGQIIMLSTNGEESISNASIVDNMWTIS